MCYTICRLLNVTNDKVEDKMKKDIELLTKVAKLYYEQKMPQQKIAKRLFLSRSKVSRLLASSKELGIVDVIVHDKLEQNRYLENEFKKRYDLKNVLIGKMNDSEDNYEIVTKIAACFFDSIIQKGDIVGISRGRTIHRFVNQFETKKNIPFDVVQLIGSMDWTGGNFKELELVHNMALAYNGRSNYLLSPFATKDINTYQTLKNIGANKMAVDLAKRADIIVNSVGSNKHGEIVKLWEKFLSNKDIKTLNESEAIGVYCGNFYNKKGELIELDITKQIVGLDLDNMRKIPIKICIATGVEKVDSIVGAIRAKLFNVLITDEDTALEVLIDENR
jgi:DNA-binding transcriptional regulator LsrR (DeoR family)